MCQLLDVHRASYYNWKATRADTAVKPRAARRARLRPLIEDIFIASGYSAGIREITKVLWYQHGERASHYLVGCLMKDIGIHGAYPQRKRRKVDIDPDEHADRVHRRFIPPVPTTVLVSDITYIRTRQGWLYLGCRAGFNNPHGGWLADLQTARYQPGHRRVDDG